MRKSSNSIFNFFSKELVIKFIEKIVKIKPIIEIIKKHNSYNNKLSAIE